MLTFSVKYSKGAGFAPSRNFVRRFARGAVLKAPELDVPEPPDWSPTATENNDWLAELETAKIQSKKPDQRFEPYVSLNEYLFHENASGGKSYIKELHTGRARIPVDQFDDIYAKDSVNRQLVKRTGVKFSDRKLIKFRSGNGGNGHVSFQRDAGRSIGPPNGGDGGDGGSIYVKTNPGLNSLHKLKVKYVAGDGTHGASKEEDGARGKDVLLEVPVGTIFKWVCSSEQYAQEDCVEMTLKQGYLHLPREQTEPWIFKEKDDQYHKEKEWFQQFNKLMSKYDTMKNQVQDSEDIVPATGLDLWKVTEEPLLLLRGGRGGLGNIHFKTQEIRNPRFAKPGVPGLEVTMLLELKTLADFGLVGLPNSGKSTLLNSISNARSKVGHWQFTTLQPVVGTVTDELDQSNDFTVADIPGIIEGAATCVEKPKGLGSHFLKHVERSSVLLVVVSLENDPKRDFDILMTELEFGNYVADKELVIVCNKADLTSNAAKYEEFVEHVKGYDCPVLPVCALKGENIDYLLEVMRSARERAGIAKQLS